MNVLILANGEPPGRELALRMAAKCDLLIATDGAAHLAAQLGLTPDVICGDFDSIDLAAARKAFPETEFVPTPDQSYADLEKALLLAQSRGAVAITIMGAAGGRIDHQFANFALLLRYGRDMALRVVDDGYQVWPVFERLDCEARPGDTVSLIALEPGVVVSISGVQWELSEFPLSPGSRAVSNIAVANHVTVEVHQGNLLFCHLCEEGGTRL